MAQDEMKKTPAPAEASAEKPADPSFAGNAPPSGTDGDTAWLFEEEDVPEAEADAEESPAAESLPEADTALADEADTAESGDAAETAAAKEAGSDESVALATAADANEAADSTGAAGEARHGEGMPAKDSGADDMDAREDALTEAPGASAADKAIADEAATDEASDLVAEADESAVGESRTEEAGGEASAETAPDAEMAPPDENADSAEAADAVAAAAAEAVANDRLREQARDLAATSEPAGEAAPDEAEAADHGETGSADEAKTAETPAAEGRTIDLGAAGVGLQAAKPKKKRRRGRLIGGVVLAVLAAIYLAGAAFYHGHFFAGTTVNGVAAGNRSPAAVKETLQNKAATYRLVLKGKDNHVEKVTASALGIAYKGDAALQKLVAKQNSFAWPVMFFRRDQNPGSVFGYDDAKVDRVVSMLHLVTGDQVIDAQNARPVVESDGRVVIKDAVAGNQLDKARLKAAMLKAIAAGDEHIDLEKDKCYVQPKYQKDSAAVKQAAKEMRRCAKAKITYLFGTDTVVVDSKVFGAWLTVDDNMHVTVDEAKAAEYLYQLALQTNTAYGKHTFKTSGGNTITVNGGSYGWRIDREAELKRLVTDIKSANGVNREPAYKQRGKIRTSTYEDIGDSYVEVSITQQHLWVYKNGRQVVSTAVVTGNTAAGHGTTPGVYYIAYKARHATLKGEDYETPVSYWMPFNGGQGIHDSWWRGAYGGSIYRGGGSHGCVNTPPSQVPQVYANVEAGTPVIVYY